MAKISNDDIELAVTALRALVRLGFTAAQVTEIINGPEPTEATVRAALSSAGRAIENARKD